MDSQTILALAQLAAQIGIPLVTAFFHKDPKTGAITVSSIMVVLDEASARNAESLQLIAAANAQPVKGA